ncbi:transposase, MuDR, MULE transposase domain protein [Tanacetum coccineum]
MYTNRKYWWKKDPLVIPLGLSWSKIGNFEKGDYGTLFVEWYNPILSMAPTNNELLQLWDEDRMSTQEYMKELVEDVDEDEDFKSVSWVSATDYVNANGGIVSGYLDDIDKYLNNGKLDLVFAIVKSCTPNFIGDLTVTIKDPSGKIPRIIHYKVLDEGTYGNDITVGASMILTNVLVFTPKPLVHYFNIIWRNVVKVFRKDTVHVSDSV